MAGELLSGQGLDKGQGGLLGQGGRAHVSAPAVEGQGFEPFEIDVTCIDNGMPLVLIRASDMGRTGYETAAKLNADTDLEICLEALRLKTGQLMELGDVAKKTYPKIKLLALLLDGGSLTTRSFISHVHHDAIGVLAAVTQGITVMQPGSSRALSRFGGFCKGSSTKLPT